MPELQMHRRNSLTIEVDRLRLSLSWRYKPTSFVAGSQYGAETGGENVMFIIRIVPTPGLSCLENFISLDVRTACHTLEQRIYVWRNSL